MQVELKNVKKSYDSRTVLDIESLVFPAGSITAVVGPNGAGKSTLLNLIGDLLEKDEGEICYDGQTEVPKEQMTMIFQEPYLLSTTVRKNILYPMKLRKIPKEQQEARLEELARELNLEAILSKKAHKLSVGEMQKTALVRGISFRPKLLLLDEPSASIDGHTTGEMERLLLHMNREEGITQILVTHNLGQARRLADYVVLLNHGQVVESCDTHRFFHQPTKPLTKKFIEGELLD